MEGTGLGYPSGMAPTDSSLLGFIGRGVVASVAGTAVMTAFQRFVEMPLTGRQDSYAPASFAQKVLPIRADDPEARERLNFVTHYALGAMWGSAYGVAAYAGLRGQKAVAPVFGVVYAGDVLLNTALGLYKPTSWTAQDIVIDVGDKLIQAAATGAIFDRFLDPVD